MKVLDLFSGCGGYSFGFVGGFEYLGEFYKKTDFKIKYAVDIGYGKADIRYDTDEILHDSLIEVRNLKNAIEQTYRYNHPETEFILADIQDLNPHDFKNIDVIIGSPPCKELSIAKANPDLEKGLRLINEFKKWVSIIKPKYWIMENVDRVIKYLDAFFPIKKIFDSMNYGVPQFRKRCFSGKYIIPKKTHAKRHIKQTSLGKFLPVKNKLKSWVTVRDAINDLILLDKNPKYSDLPNLIQRKKHSPQKLDKPSSTLYSSCLEKPQYSAFIELNSKIILTDQYGINTKCHTPIYDATERPSRTITVNPQKKVITQNGKNIIYKRITVRESARLQSFPDSFKFFGSDSAKFRMIGNAVSPLMAYALATALMK